MRTWLAFPAFLSLLANALPAQSPIHPAASDFGSLRSATQTPPASSVQPSSQIALLVSTGHDSCALAEVITGTGSFGFDNSAATTSAEGQLTPNCVDQSSIGMPRDVWFQWTAPQNGRVWVSTCGGTVVDTKLGVYAGSGCPATGASAMTCIDDHSEQRLQARVSFNAFTGNTYLIQLASSPVGSPPGGSGTFTISYSAPSCSVDDGSTEDAVNLTSAGELCWIQRFGAVGQITTVSAIQTAWGTTVGTYPAGGAAQVALWDDPNDDGIMADALLLASATTTIQNPNTDMFQTVPLAAPMTVNGVYYVGAKAASGPGMFVGPIDLDGCDYELGRSWIGFMTAGAFNFASLSSNTGAPIQCTSIGVPLLRGEWQLRAVCAPAETGVPYCFGDGTGAVCPCSPTPVPHGQPGKGCPTNAFAGGARAFATGNASLTSDTLVLTGVEMINGSMLFYQGPTQQSAGAGTGFGDGKRCVSPSAIRRFKTKPVAGNTASYPGATDPLIHTAGLVVATGDMHYQGWYRSANPTFCTPLTFNLTNGLRITWTP